MFSASDFFGFSFCLLILQPEQRRRQGRMEALHVHKVSNGGERVRQLKTLVQTENHKYDTCVHWVFYFDINLVNVDFFTNFLLRSWAFSLHWGLLLALPHHPFCTNCTPNTTVLPLPVLVSLKRSGLRVTCETI